MLLAFIYISSRVRVTFEFLFCFRQTYTTSIEEKNEAIEIEIEFSRWMEEQFIVVQSLTFLCGCYCSFACLCNSSLMYSTTNSTSDKRSIHKCHFRHQWSIIPISCVFILSKKKKPNYRLYCNVIVTCNSSAVSHRHGHHHHHHRCSIQFNVQTCVLFYGIILSIFIYTYKLGVRGSECLWMKRVVFIKQFMCRLVCVGTEPYTASTDI